MGGGSGVAVETKGGVGWAEQEEKRRIQMAESKIRVVRRGGMEGILTELFENNLPRINEKTSF